jgi:predicted nucleotidyltransferase
LRSGPWPEPVVERLVAALDALVRGAREIDGVAAVLVFGSYARGDFGRKSDVDLLVLAAPAEDGALATTRRDAAELVAEVESSFRLPMHLVPLIAAANAPDELGPDLLHAIWTDGVVLFGEAAALGLLQPSGLAPWYVVRFSAADRPPSSGVQLSRLLHGRGGRPGLVRPPALALGRGALLVPATQVRSIREVLDEVGATYDVVAVWRDA